MERAKKGVILFSLGTLGDKVLTKHRVDMLAEVFGRLEQRIIWRLKSKKFTLKTNKESSRNMRKDYIVQCHLRFGSKI